jgi:LacI family transcriptional regulator
VPPLTSVDLKPQRIGYEAASLLDTMMAGKQPATAEILVPPSGIVTRLSTDVLATDDQSVVLAVRFIRAHAAETIRVRDVLRHAHLSRAALEPRIKRVLGRTIHQEIQRIRIERVKELLVTSDAPLKWIAAATGFRYPEYMMRVFHRATGRTPNQFRKQARRTTP